MKKPALMGAAALIAMISLSPTRAHAGDGAIAAGIIGGLAVGALAGSAIANPHRAPVYVYDGAPVYRPRVRVYRYYEAPYYSGYDHDSDYGYSSGYRDGYNDAASDW
ncbi:hypothetical protein ACVIW2_007448 [Bradyrhizobium huanghuaihaiense]|uniref:PXPV repeat-containing protein n=1 Tax=Bradyrhizobium huanghuaihaiense TaxID=990078 RepID=A0A562RUU5_9BRAD|nr:hypothetical protein [Bradyrhizobium huanghuaihaiense]TWI72847.1 hypothetical protein IQ16_02426 [Bradyrhizobium huanghuaihaiense]